MKYEPERDFRVLVILEQACYILIGRGTISISPERLDTKPSFIDKYVEVQIVCRIKENKWVITYFITKTSNSSFLDEEKLSN